MARLARDDPRRIAWRVWDKYSSRFLQDAASSDDAVFSNAEWAEAVARYAGVASPACKPWVGMKLQVKDEPVLDPHGDVLFAATTCLNKGGARTMWHDGMQRALKRTCQVAGVRFEQGLVVPIAREAGMGDDAIRSLDREERAARSKAGGGKRLLPDISVEGNLGDVKTLNSLKWYTLRADGGFAGGKAPVDRKAANVNTKYLHKAHTADVKHNGQPAGQRGGPLETASGNGGTWRDTCLAPSARCRSVWTPSLGAAPGRSGATGPPPGCSGRRPTRTRRITFCLRSGAIGGCRTSSAGRRRCFTCWRKPARVRRACLFLIGLNTWTT